MNSSELMRVAGAMVARGKGILAADESGGTIKKRFDGIKLESTEEHRRTYREMLFTAPGAAESVSGVILYDETIRQKTRDGTPFPQYLTKQGIIPGIKVDLCANRAPPQAVAEATLRVLRRHVPPAVPGIAFLSGGQSPTEATLHLSLMNKLGPLPWSLTFSYGRALQDTALKAWGGVAANFAAG